MLLITDATLLTFDAEQRILTDHALLIDGATIRAIAPQRELLAQYPDAERLSLPDQYVMPGGICAHTHFYGAFARGMAIPGAPPEDFPAILRRLWWNLDKALDADAVRLSALVCLVDAIKHGTTTLIDHHASPNAIDGSLDWIADAVEQAGLRAVLCYEVTDRDGLDKAEAGIAENLRFLRSPRPLVKGTFGLHASLSLSDETLRKCRAFHAAGFHIHVAEHEADEIDSVAQYGKRVVHRLRDHGLLTDQTIAAHCVHIDADELAILTQHGVWISHQPRSNMNNAVGALPFDAFWDAGAKLVLGNDGFSNVMWEEWKAAYFLHKVANRDPRRANGSRIFEMATAHNARLVEQFFPGQRIGQLITGAAADMIAVAYHPYTPLTAGNLPWHILFGFEASAVTTTIAAGRVLLRDRQLTTLDERAIAAAARALVPAVWERYQRLAGA